MFIMKRIFIFMLFTALLAGCGNQQKKSVPAENPIPQKQVVIPPFNADSAYRYVAEQVAFGPRIPGSEAQRECAEYLAGKLRSFGAVVTMQEFQMRAYNGNVLDGINIIGAINPEANRRILLGAHWDSRPYADHDPDPENHRKPIDGANDGASGVGVLLEIARAMQSTTAEVGVDIVFFDLEDYGPPEDAQNNQDGGDYWGLGSQYWAKNPHEYDYRAAYGILLDMVGAPDAVFPIEGFSAYYAPHIVRKVWNKAQSLGYDNYFPQTQGTYVNDDHLYVNKYAGIPMVNIIHQDVTSSNNAFFEYWHTVNDNMDAIDKATLGVVGEVVLAVVYD